ncbi:MAG: hypothetical protein Q7U05_05155 [Polaromonas sp.]|jgi:hypothetical protein|nr:hypothetical protein [Polaromonas sp.]
MTTDKTFILVSPDQLSTFISSALKNAGLPDQDAVKVAGLTATGRLVPRDASRLADATRGLFN